MNLINKIDFEKNNGTVPVITQDATTNEVLMLAHMDKEACELTLLTSFAHYFSRSKQRVWKKGETSGHTQKVVDMLLDCDNDTILLKVKQEGVACHTGRGSCFFTSIKNQEVTKDIKIDTTSTYGVIDTLYHTILERKNSADTKTSYTATLLNKKENSLLKKIVEEAGEFTFAIKDKNEKEIIYEAADLTYHMLVALAKENISPDRVKQELARRFKMSGIEEKNSRTK